MIDQVISDRLADQVALVTGAGGGAQGGIGAGIARCLAAQGALVCVNDLTEASAQATVDQLAAFGAKAHVVLGDVSTSTSADEMVAACEEQAGPLAILVNNAGVVGRSSVANTSDDEWSRVLRVNLDGPFYVSRAAVQVMQPRGFGRIVNVASIAGTRMSYLGGAAYTASKSGLLGLTRHLAAEVARYGITVNAVLPGVTTTPLVQASTTPESAAAIAAQVPAQRSGTPEDPGSVVAFLAGADAAYVTGTAIPVDGAITVLPGDFSSYLTHSGKDVG